jgi:hypothetical protein
MEKGSLWCLLASCDSSACNVVIVLDVMVLSDWKELECGTLMLMVVHLGKPFFSLDSR